ncbi:zinc finger and SCAN domain-containing protein 29-like [Drosophila suzukii]|uniref:Zinc finger and SCAN domain-containing protein 29-like n=1 Tax=Drosophila suzukii TaxID=28584 RepID=A0ABM4TNR4_DROSZ
MESKRSFWSDAEVTELLGLVKENNILSKLDRKTKRNNLVYRGLAESMKAKNMIKSRDQIKTKLRMLKKSYFEVKRSNAVSGAARKRCTHFEELEEMYGTRPVSHAVGVESSEEGFVAIGVFDDLANEVLTETEDIDDSSSTVDAPELLVETSMPSSR